MALFRQNKTQRTVLPEEVNDYYKAQKRERTGVALMLGLAALIATLIVGFALFFGGRWVYQKISGKNKTPTAIIDDKKASDKSANDKSSDKSSSSSQDNSSSTSGTSSSNSSAGSNSSTSQANGGSGGASSSASTTNSGGGAANNSGSTTTPALGDEPTSPLPHTGDEGH